MKGRVVRIWLVSLVLSTALVLMTHKNGFNLVRINQIDQIRQYVIAAGGEVNATNSSLTLSSTFGQMDGGHHNNGTYRLSSGFWIPRKPIAHVTILSPDTSHSAIISQDMIIQWSTKGETDRVYIELSRSDGAAWDTLFSNTENDGMETWKVEMPISNTCLIRISDTQDARIMGKSGLFSIVPERVDAALPMPGPLTFGSAKTAYRMISVPLELDNSGLAAVLVDDLGSYDKKNWRFFDYQDPIYQEFGDPNIRTFEPGRSFFLIVRDPEVVVSTPKAIDAGPGALVADSIRTVDLLAGWNFVANPYDTDILASSFSVPGENFELKEYTGSWVTLDVVNSVLKPWQGYALKVDNLNEYELQIRPRFVSSQPIVQARQTNEADLWSIQIVGKCLAASDLENFVGIRPHASKEWDRFDSYEPPPIGDFVRVYFPHREWSYRPDIYSKDFRPESSDGSLWEIEVQSNIENTVNLTFLNLDNLPAGYEIWLVDNMLKRSQDLRQSNKYEFENLKHQIHELTLLVGKNDFIEGKLMQAGAIPDKYELFQNFPNPFNPTTVIGYSLPEPQTVTLKIYNVYGQEVARLIDGELKGRGFNAKSWDGRNNHGVAVASGFYLYQLQAGTFLGTKKLILAK